MTPCIAQFPIPDSERKALISSAICIIERMKPLLPVLIVLAVLASAFGLAKILLSYRARDMRSLAFRRGFQVIDTLPASFCMTCYPADSIKVVMNVIEGQQNGIPVLIFDSVVGEGKGTYCTFIAAQTTESIFGVDDSREKVIQSGKWAALYRFRFLQTPGTLGISRIEDHLDKL